MDMMTTLNSENFGIFKDGDGDYYIASSTDDDKFAFKFLKTDGSEKDVFMSYNLDELTELRDLINRLIENEIR